MDDPYSHLCAQTLPLIAKTYDVEIKTFLVPSPTKEAAPEPDLLKSHSLEDAKIIAPYYGLTFPSVNELPNDKIIQMAQWAFISMENQSFEDIIKIGDLLWKNDQSSIEDLFSELPNEEIVESTLSKNSKLRKNFGHYLGGVFVLPYNMQLRFGTSSRRIDQLSQINLIRKFFTYTGLGITITNHQYIIDIGTYIYGTGGSVIAIGLGLRL